MSVVGNLNSISELGESVWTEDPGGIYSRVYRIKVDDRENEEMVRVTPYDLQRSDQYTVQEVMEEIPGRIVTFEEAERNPQLDVSEANASKKTGQSEKLSFNKFLSRFGRCRILSE